MIAQQRAARRGHQRRQALERLRWEQRHTNEWPGERRTEEVANLYEVEADESVTVPAGTFRTLRTVCRTQRTGAVVSEQWWAPEVKHWVRQRWVGVERELTSFNVK